MKTFLVRTLFLCTVLCTAASDIFSMETKQLPQPIIEDTRNTDSREKEKVDDNGPLPKELHITPSPFSLLNFAKKNWLPIVGLTTLSAYCVYDRQALPEVISWSKNLWQTLPRIFKGFVGLGVAYKTYNYFFNKPALYNNSNHNKCITWEVFEPYMEMLAKSLEVYQLKKKDPKAAIELAIEHQLQQEQELMKYMPDIGFAGQDGFGSPFPKSTNTQTPETD